MQFLNEVMQYIVVPIAGFLAVVYTRQQEHHTEIAVLKSRVVSDKQAHDRELGEIRDTTNKIFGQLKSIEEALRK